LAVSGGFSKAKEGDVCTCNLPAFAFRNTYWHKFDNGEKNIYITLSRLELQRTMILRCR